MTALEVLEIGFSECGKRLRREPDLLANTVGAIMMMLVDVEDDVAAWELESDEKEKDVCQRGHDCLGGLASAVGDPVFRVAMPALRDMVHDDSWKVRRAAMYVFGILGGESCGRFDGLRASHLCVAPFGMCALRCAACSPVAVCPGNTEEGCASEAGPSMAEALDEITLDLVAAGLKDEHPRVQFAAANTLGLFAMDFAEEFREGMGVKVLPLLLDAIKEGKSERVVAHSASAIVKLMEVITKAQVEPLLPELVSALVRYACEERWISIVCQRCDCPCDRGILYFNGGGVTCVYVCVRQGGGGGSVLRRGGRMSSGCLAGSPLTNKLVSAGSP